MAKQSGLGDGLLVHGVDLSGDTQSVAMASPLSPIDVTSIDRSAYERIGGLRSGSMTWTSYFNPTRAHPEYSALPYTDVNLTYQRGKTLGAPAAILVAKSLKYDGTRANSGEFTFALEAQCNDYGLLWGNQVTPGIRTDTVITNGASVDGAASSAYGFYAMVHVTAFTGTSVTVTVQHSSDNTSFSSLGAFPAATGVGSSLISGTSTVNRYVRVVSSGTFSSASFLVTLVRRAA